LAAVLTTVAIFVFGGGPSTKTVVIKKGSFIPPPNWSGSSPLFIDDYFSPANLTIKVGGKSSLVQRRQRYPYCNIAVHTKRGKRTRPDPKPGRER